MEATCVTHIGVCVREMAESLKFYRDALGMKVIGEKITDITEGGAQTARLDNYAQERTTRHWVSLAYEEGAPPTLTLTSPPGEKPDGPESLTLIPTAISKASTSATRMASWCSSTGPSNYRLG